jgi:hypothetical protein
MDLFSRKIVGWSMRSTIARELALDAVLMAVRRAHRFFFVPQSRRANHRYESRARR